MTYQECKDIITELKSEINTSLFTEDSALDKIGTQLVELADAVDDLNDRVNDLEGA